MEESNKLGSIFSCRDVAYNVSTASGIPIQTPHNIDEIQGLRLPLLSAVHQQ